MLNTSASSVDIFKKILSICLFICATYFTAGIIINSSSFESIGHLMRRSSLPIFFWGVLLIFYLYRQWGLSFSITLNRSELSRKVIFSITIFAFFLSLLIIEFAFLGPIYFIIIPLCIVGVAVGLIYVIRDGDSKGIIYVLVVYPLIIFIQHWFRWGLSGDPYEIHSINIFMPYEIIWLLLFIALFTYKIISRKRFELKLSAIQRLFLIFGFFLFVSALKSPVPLTSLKYLYRDCVLPLIFLFLFTNSIKNIADFKRLVKGLLFSSMVLVLINLYFFWRTGGFFTETEELFRSDLATTVTGYVNLISILSLITLPLSISSCIYEKRLLTRAAYLISAMICLVVIVISKNRSAQIACIATLPFLFLYAKANLRYLLIPMGAIVMIAVLLRVPFIWDMVTSRYYAWTKGGMFVANVMDVDEITVDLWRSAIRIFLDHPLFGIGAGMWERVYSAYSSMPGAVIELSGNKPHSLFLQYFAYSGVGAGISVVLIYLYTIIKSVKRAMHTMNKELYALSIGLSWSICALSIHELFRGYQVFNYFGFTVMTICVFYGFDHLLKNEESK